MPLTHSAVKTWTPGGTALLLENFAPRRCNSKIFGFDVWEICEIFLGNKMQSFARFGKGIPSAVIKKYNSLCPEK